MSSELTYIFKIEGYTPETMPFTRLMEYYDELKKMFGSQLAKNMHLVDLKQGSHATAFKVEQEQHPDFQKKLESVGTPEADKKAQNAFDTINNMLHEDEAEGAFTNAQGNNIIHFPGKKIDEEGQISVRDAAIFTGRLYQLSGNHDEDCKARIETETHGVVYCSTTNEIARSLREFLFEDVAVSGRGQWTRTNDGVWSIADFSITDFQPVAQETLEETVNRIRNLDIKWPEDTLNKLAELRDSDEQIQ